VAQPTAGLADHAGKLGFVRCLPPDTQFYFGTLNVSNHLAALAGSSFFGEISAYLEDKTPSPSTGETSAKKSKAPWGNLGGQDAFIALGKGAPQFLTLVKEVAAVNQRESVSQLLKVLPDSSASEGDEAASDSLARLETLRALAERVEKMTVPEIMFGFAGKDPAALLATLVSPMQREFWAKLGGASDVTLPGGGKFTLHQGKLGSLLGGFEAQIMEHVQIESQRKPVRAILAALQEKPLAVAWGTHDGHAVLVLGSQRPEFRFQQRAADSLIGRSEWQPLAGNMGNNLLAVGWADAKILNAVSFTHSVVGLLRQVLESAGNEGPLGGLAKPLKKSLDDLEALEHQMKAPAAKNATWAAWWSQGLHVEMHGGQAAEGLPSARPLTQLSLAKAPGAVFSHRSLLGGQQAAYEDAWWQGWGTLAQEAVWAVLNRQKNAEVATIKAWVQKDILPSFQQMAASADKLLRNGLGDERGWLLALPVAEEKSDAPSLSMMPTLVYAAALQDRKAVSLAWLEMEPALQSLAKAFPSGQTPPDLTPQMDIHSSLEVYTLPLPIPPPVPQPAIGLGKDLFLVGTSQGYLASLAPTLMQKQAPGPALISAWTLNVARIHSLVRDGLPPSEATAGMVPAARWLAPLGELRGFTTVQPTASGSGRGLVRRWQWDISDPKRFD
jgi:hypothetical protein